MEEGLYIRWPFKNYYSGKDALGGYDKKTGFHLEIDEIRWRERPYTVIISNPWAKKPNNDAGLAAQVMKLGGLTIEARLLLSPSPGDVGYQAAVYGSVMPDTGWMDDVKVDAVGDGKIVLSRDLGFSFSRKQHGKTPLEREFDSYQCGCCEPSTEDQTEFWKKVRDEVAAVYDASKDRHQFLIRLAGRLNTSIGLEG